MNKRKIVEIFQKISLIVAIFIMVVFFIPMIVGITPFVVVSGSMEPEIKTGAIAYVNSHAKPESIKVGDIIGFVTDVGKVTHRVARINEDGSFVTKGDSNDIEDSGSVTYKDFKGKTIFSIPFLGKIAVYLKTRLGLLLVATFVGLNVLCIIFDKKIYEDEIPSSFREAIMKCQNIDEIKEVIVKEMDTFKAQMLDDVSKVDFEENQNRNEDKILDNSEDDNTSEIEEISSQEIENLMARIDAINDDLVDIDKVKKELLRFDNPRLRELKDILKKNKEAQKIITVESTKKIAEENNQDEKNNEQSSENNFDIQNIQVTQDAQENQEVKDIENNKKTPDILINQDIQNIRENFDISNNQDMQNIQTNQNNQNKGNRKKSKKKNRSKSKNKKNKKSS